MCSAQIILRSVAGEPATTIAQDFGVTAHIVGHWRKRFHAHGRSGLADARRSGRPRTHDDCVAALLQTVLATAPPGATHGSVRALAARAGISKSVI